MDAGARPRRGIVIGDDGVARCWWCAQDPSYRRYHDSAWGRPIDDDRGIFEVMSLEGAQSGLGWLTILRKRDGYLRAFRSFDIARIARYGPRQVERLMRDPGIVRHRPKIEATINNARRCPELIEEFGSLAAYIWAYEPAPHTPPKSLTWTRLMSRAESPEAKAMSKDLKRRGWSFAGPTTLYSSMEAMGLVNDHLTGCHVRDEVERARTRFRRPSRSIRQRH